MHFGVVFQGAGHMCFILFHSHSKRNEGESRIPREGFLNDEFTPNRSGAREEEEGS